MSSKRGKSRGRDGGGKKEDGRSLAFQILSESQTADLLKLEDVDELESKIVEIMRLSDYTIDLKQASLVDYYVGVLCWAKQENFGTLQTSAFFTAACNLLDNIKDKQMPMLENLKEMKKILVGVGMENPEVSGGLECLSLEQGKKIVDYLKQSLFQHYHLYNYIFSWSQAEEVIRTDLTIEVAKPASMPWPPPLDEALSEETYQQFVATPPPTPEQSQDAVDVEPNEAEVAEDTDRMKQLMAQLTEEEVQQVVDSVAAEMLQGVEADVAAKIRERENNFVSRINKIHRIASPKSAPRTPLGVKTGK